MSVAGLNVDDPNFQSLRGQFKFNANQFPMHTFYLGEVQKNARGKISSIANKATVRRRKLRCQPSFLNFNIVTIGYSVRY